MSKSRSRRRLACAGLTVGAVSAALLAAPTAAFAGTNVGPWLLTPGASNATISDPQATFNTSTAVVQFATASCRSTYAAPAVGSNTWDATVTARTGTQLTFTVPSSGVAAGNNGIPKLHYLCVYASNTTGAAQQGGATAYVGYAPSMSAMTGMTGGGNPLSVTVNPSYPAFTGINTVAAVFNTATCNATLGTSNPQNLVVTNVNKQGNTATFNVPPGAVVPAGTSGPTVYNVCLYDAGAAGGTGALLAMAPYSVNLVGLSASSGSYLVSNGITGSSTAPFLSGVTAPGVLVVQGGGCPGTYGGTGGWSPAPIPVTGAGAVRRLTNYRLAVTLPPLTQTSPTPVNPVPYMICFYSGTGGSAALVGSGSYTATVLATPTAVSPSAGPATGNSMITVAGTDFPTDARMISATLGGVPLTEITPLTDKAFTAKTPAHAIESNVSLVVTTPSGTKALQGAYSFLNPVKVTPNTAPSTAPTIDVDVQGMGFLGIAFGDTGNAGRVFLVDGVYDGSEAATGTRANGPVAECKQVLPISDEELVCTLQLNRRLNAAGGFFDSVAYMHPLTSDVATKAGSRVIESAGGLFVANDVGQPITQATAPTNIPANSIITSVLGRTKAVISAPALVTASGLTATVGAMLNGGLSPTPSRTIANALSTTQGSTTVTLTSGTFNVNDVGKIFYGTTGVPNYTTIVSVAPGGGSATLSAPATATTLGTLAAVSTTGTGSDQITSVNIAAGDQYGVIGTNTINIPPGTTITAVGSGSATLSANITTGAGPAVIPINRVVTANLYAPAPVPVRTFANAISTTQDSPVVTLTSGAFTSADVGRVFYGTTGIPNFASIVSVAPGGASATLSVPATATTMGTLAAASTTTGSDVLTSANLIGGDQYAVVGANTLNIPQGTTLIAASTGTAQLSATVATGAGPASISLNRVVTGFLYAGSAVPDGSYNLTVVSNGALNAADTDPEYSQTAVTSGSTFTVGAF